MICSNCKKEIADGSEFCKNCGNNTVSQDVSDEKQIVLNKASCDTVNGESFVNRIKSIHWFVKLFIYAGLFSLILFQNFRELAVSMLVLFLYSAYSTVRPPVKERRMFYFFLSVASFIGIFIFAAIGQLLDWWN